MYASFTAHLKRRAESIKVGDPLEHGCRLGPLVNDMQYKKVLSYIEVRSGRGVAAGGGGPGVLAPAAVRWRCRLGWWAAVTLDLI